MNRVTKTGVKCTGIMIAGSTVSIFAGCKTASFVYDKTEDYTKASAAGVLVGGAGLMVTTGVAMDVAEKDSKQYTDEDMRTARKIEQTMDTANSGIKLLSNILKLASAISH